jgi:amino-acid N-acetyltransferase
MSSENMTISGASPSDLDDILALLTAVNLTHEGVREHFESFLVRHDAEGQLIGCAGWERYGELAMLRSIAISPNLQHSGIGSKLTASILDYAASNGIREVVLLTTTARDFFSRRFGFSEAERADYDSRVAQSPEWTLPRCSSAAFMKLDVSSRNGK